MSTTTTQKKTRSRGNANFGDYRIAGFMYFTTRGEMITGLVVGMLFGGVGYWEYKRRIRDLEQAEIGGNGRDPFEERERRR